MTTHRFEIERLAPMPWRNGAGTTRELVCQPQGAGMAAFDWRVSIAHIARDGPFSTFEGVDRVITLLQGDGVRLRSAAGGFDHRLDTPLTPFAFPGDVPVDAELLAGASDDFNVMTRRATCRAHVQVLCAASELAAAAQGLLMAVQGRWQVRGAASTSVTLAAGHGLWWSTPSTPRRLEPLSPDAILLAVRVDPVSP